MVMVVHVYYIAGHITDCPVIFFPSYAHAHITELNQSWTSENVKRLFSKFDPLS